MSFCLKLNDDTTGTDGLVNSTSMGSFISEINQELSVACSLPFTVPKKEIERIIHQSAKWMYRNYEEAAEERYYYIPAYVFQTEAFKCDRTLVLPKCILTMHGLDEVDDGGLQSTFDGTADTSVNKFFFRDVFFGQGKTASGSEAMMYYIVNAMWLDMALHITTSPISWEYNPNSNKLVILGRTPNTGVVLSVYKELELEYLMNDDIFFRYVVAKCKSQLSRILGTFNFNLPGGITINYDILKDEGTTEIDKIEEEIKEGSGTPFFFLTRNT